MAQSRIATALAMMGEPLEEYTHGSVEIHRVLENAHSRRWQQWGFMQSAILLTEKVIAGELPDRYSVFFRRLAI